MHTSWNCGPTVAIHGWTGVNLSYALGSSIDIKWREHRQLWRQPFPPLTIHEESIINAVGPSGSKLDIDCQFQYCVNHQPYTKNKEQIKPLSYRADIVKFSNGTNTGQQTRAQIEQMPKPINRPMSNPKIRNQRRLIWTPQDSPRAMNKSTILVKPPYDLPPSTNKNRTTKKRRPNSKRKTIQVTQMKKRLSRHPSGTRYSKRLRHIIETKSYCHRTTY